MMLIYMLMAALAQLIDSLSGENLDPNGDNQLSPKSLLKNNGRKLGGFHQQHPNDLRLSFSPRNLTKLAEGVTRDVQVMVSFQQDQANSNTSFPGGFSSFLADNNKNVTICYDVEDPLVAWASAFPASANISSSNKEKQQHCQDVELIEEKLVSVEDGEKTLQVYLANTTFSVKGIFLGKTHVTVTAWRRPKTTDKLVKAGQADFRTRVVRNNNRLQHIFVGTLASLLILANVLMGARLNLDTVCQVLRRPIAPLIGFTCQYLFMPLISYGLACLVFLPHGLNHLALGLFTTGCSPGGGASNGYTVLMDGNVDLSITMTFLSTLAALGLMPMWLYLVGRQFLENSVEEVRITIPYRNIFTSLFCLIVPLLIGVFIRSKSKVFAEKADKILRPLFIAIIVFICTFGVYANLYMFKMMTWRVVLGGMFLPLLGFSFGTLMSVLCGQPLSNIKAIAIETGIQNTGISIVLLQLSFGQPEGDMAAVLPVVVAMFTPPPLLVALAVHYIVGFRGKYKLRREKSSNGSSTQQQNGTNNKALEGVKGPHLNLGLEGSQSSFVSSLHTADSAKPLYALAGDQQENAA